MTYRNNQWAQIVEDNKSLREQRRKRAADRAYKRMIESDKAAALRAQESVLLATNLYGGPVNLTIQKAALEAVNRRWSLRSGGMSW